MTALDDRAVLVLEDVEVDGRPHCRVRCRGGAVDAVEPAGSRPGGGGRSDDTTVVDGRGGALLPGLHDHHLHLMAMAARATSVPCGPPEVHDAVELGERLRRAARLAEPGRWVRGVAYDDAVAGPLDAPALDDLLGDLRHVPVRVQHRSGHQWIVNRDGVGRLERAGIGPGDHGHGVYTDRDDELRPHWSEDAAPDLAGVGRSLAACGVTGVTDATVANGPEVLGRFEAAQVSGALPQRVHLLGRDLPPRCGRRLSTGACKIVLTEHDLPALDRLVAEIRGAGERGVAIHCASREALVLAAVALREAPGVPARVEHASVAPPDVVDVLRHRPVTVVTQPAFVFAHGDRYLREVDSADVPWLYRLRGWRSAGIALAAGSDAPFGPADPWLSMRSATERRTERGEPLGRHEALTPEAARDLYLTPLGDPGGRPRRVGPGTRADLCLLSVPWHVARRDLRSDHVRAVFVGGRPVVGG